MTSILASEIITAQEVILLADMCESSSFNSYQYRLGNYSDDNCSDDGDTDDASETGDVKEQEEICSSTGSNGGLTQDFYHVQLANLKKQLEDINQRTHPQFLYRYAQLQQQYNDRLLRNETCIKYLMDRLHSENVNEKLRAKREYEEKLADLKENLLADLEDKKRLIDAERYTLELDPASTDVKTTVTRKLRRRPNEPLPTPEKRRKPNTGQMLIYILDEKDIELDLKIIQRSKQLTSGVTTNENGESHPEQQRPFQNAPTEPVPTSVEARIEDNKLLFQRRWYYRGQSIFVEGKDLPKFPGTITAIGNEVIWVKRSNESKVRISLSNLIKGKIIIKKRA